jgi:3-methylcrotonyl-CoA carboxylase alpha subunit
MEMNTRLQVEHPVTEAITGEDLVAWQFRVAAGEPLPLTQEQVAQRISERGWAIEARIYAENPAQNFMPDSGKLLHLKTPKTTESVRIDAGFVEGDTISAAYDGMIAKLIVNGPSRKVAISKLYTALQQYEIVGLNTNIEFLKKICQSPAFISGDVETGYIKKHHDELFQEELTDLETFAQAALGLLMKDATSKDTNLYTGPHGQLIGFDSTIERQFQFRTSSYNAKGSVITVIVNQIGWNNFTVSIEGPEIQKSFKNVICDYQKSTITTFFPHTRIETTIVADSDMLTLFQHGKQTRLAIMAPTWYEKALGIKEVTNSVLAPMPCKVLRNEVNEGDIVEKDQALVV